MSEIPEVLDRSQDTFISMRGQQTVREALNSLKKQGGDIWWHRDWWLLVVQLNDGRYLAGKFSDLRPRLEEDAAAFLERKLSSLEGDALKIVRYASHEIALQEAYSFAENSDPPLLLLRWQGAVVGYINAGQQRDLYFDDIPLYKLVPEPKPEKPSSPSQPEPTSEGSREDVPPEKKNREPSEPVPSAGTTIETIQKVEGDVVAGNMTIHGDKVAGDKHDHYYIIPEKLRTVQQKRCFEAAFPRSCIVGEEKKLLVTVRLCEAESPFGEQTEAKSIDDHTEVLVNLPIVDNKTGKLEPVDLAVSVTSADLNVVGLNTKYLTVWPDGRTEMRWFLLKPKKTGGGDIMIELSQGDRLIGELTLSTTTVAAHKGAGALGGLDFSLRIANFSMQLNFSA